MDIVQGEATMMFVPLTYTLATEEAERIGVDHVVRMSTNEVGEKSVGKFFFFFFAFDVTFLSCFYFFSVAEHLMAQYSAIKMLHSRVKLVLAYIKEVESGALEPNHEILREAYSMSNRLPVVQGSAFREEFYTVSLINVNSKTFLIYFSFSNAMTLASSHIWEF